MSSADFIILRIRKRKIFNPQFYVRLEEAKKLLDLGV